MDKLEAFRGMAAELDRGEPAFPTSVNASLKIKRVIDDPECHLETAAKVVASEPVLSARVVAIANSAAYNHGDTEITSVRNAVTMLGFRTLRSLVAALVVRQFGHKIANPSLRAKANRLWEHTVHVAALSQVIARHATAVDPDTAMFAGVVHEVGGFYLLSRADENPGLLDGDPKDWTGYGEALIGHAIFKALVVPESVVSAVDVFWQGAGNLPPESLVDVLHWPIISRPLRRPSIRAPMRRPTASSARKP